MFLNGSRTTSRQFNNRQKNYHSGQYSDRGMSHKHSGLKFGRGRGTSRVFGYPITLKNELIAVTTTSIKNEIGRTPGERTLDRPCLTMVLPWLNTVSRHGLPFGSDTTLVGYVTNIQIKIVFLRS